MQQPKAMIQSRTLALEELGFSTRVLTAQSDGPPVLLLHGNPDSAGEWERTMNELGSDCSCLAPDLPGFGQCDEPPERFDYSVDAHVRFVDQVLRAARQPGKLTLVVHDIGGVFGVPWAARNLDRLSALVVTNTVAFENFTWFDIARTWGDSSFLGRIRAEAGMWAIGKGGGRLFRKIFRSRCPDLGEADLDRMTKEFALSPKALRCTLRLFRQMTRPSFFEGYRAMLEKIRARVPIRVVWGEKDPFVPKRYAQEFGAASVETLPNGGHWVALTHPDRVAHAIRAT
jgi:haloalkane dehalogenase